MQNIDFVFRMNKNNWTANVSENQCEIAYMGDNFYQDDFPFFPGFLSLVTTLFAEEIFKNLHSVKSYTTIVPVDHVS